MLDTVIQLHSERDTKTGWGTRQVSVLIREVEHKHNCYGRKTNNQKKVGYRFELGVTQGITCRCLTHPTISRSSTANRERYQLNTHSKLKNMTYKPSQKTKRDFSRWEKSDIQQTARQ